jgi:hypothetical protein
MPGRKEFAMMSCCPVEETLADIKSENEERFDIVSGCQFESNEATSALNLIKWRCNAVDSHKQGNRTTTVTKRKGVPESQPVSDQLWLDSVIGLSLNKWHVDSEKVCRVDERICGWGSIIPGSLQFGHSSRRHGSRHSALQLVIGSARDPGTLTKRPHEPVDDFAPANRLARLTADAARCSAELIG